MLKGCGIVVGTIAEKHTIDGRPGVKIQRVRYPVHQTNIIVRTIAVMFLYTCIDDAQQAKTAGVADLDGKNLIVV
eukprot:1187783-Prorocentrum_minimum.AAC.4